MYAIITAIVVFLSVISTKAFAEYTSLVPTGDLSGITGDTHTMAVWLVTIMVSIAGLGVLIHLLRR